MLYVVGDSNSVYTSATGILTSVDTTLCAVGWTTDDVLRAVRRQATTRSTNKMNNATGFFLFAGLNDRTTGGAIADNILRIVEELHNLREVPIVVAVPFCAKDAATTSSKECDHRRTAAKNVAAKLKKDHRVTTVTVHVTDEMYVKDNYKARKMHSTKTDPLHLSREGYDAVAKAVQRAWFQSLIRKAARAYATKVKDSAEG